MHGGIAGAIAVLITSTICKGANIEIAVYSTGTLFTGVVLFALIMSIVAFGVRSSDVEAVVQVIGLWIGLVSTLFSLAPSNESPTGTT